MSTTSTLDTDTLATGEEVTFRPETADPAKVGYWNAFAGDQPVTVTIADDGVTLETDLGAGFFPHGVTIAQLGSRAAWREAQGY